MLDLDPAFRPVTRPDGHHRLEDLGLVGDGQTVALVGLGGCIPGNRGERRQPRPRGAAL